MSKKKRYVVTGGAGFIGSHIVDLLIKLNHKVTVIDNLSTGSIKNLNPLADFEKFNLSNYKKLVKSFNGCEGIFHLAALPRIQPSFEDPILHNNVNINASLNIINAMKESYVKKIVFSSTSACYGNPIEIPTTENCPVSFINPYALQKYTSEQYILILCKKFNLKSISLRYFNVYGPRSFNPKNKLSAYSSVVGIFNYAKLNNLPIKITGKGNQRRDFVHVYDVANANYLAMKSQVSDMIFNVGTGKDITIKKLSYFFTKQPTFIKARGGEANITCASIKKIQKNLKWKPKIDLKKAIQIGII